jgi:hypothetical protein
MGKTPRNRDALYLVWQESRAIAMGAIQRRLEQGEEQRLYRLRSWVIVHNEAHALITPSASLDEIVDELWQDEIQPLKTRWVSRAACAHVAREIERVPVLLGLSPRPEQWPHSSAATE